MMRILVCGGRDYTDREAVYAALDSLHAERRFTALIAGRARGADTLAEDWAKARGIPTEIYMADWKAQGPAAGLIRNKRMLDEGKPDIVVAFLGGKGTGQHDRAGADCRRARIHVVVTGERRLGARRAARQLFRELGIRTIFTVAAPSGPGTPGGVSRIVALARVVLSFMRFNLALFSFSGFSLATIESAMPVPRG